MLLLRVRMLLWISSWTFIGTTISSLSTSLLAAHPNPNLNPPPCFLIGSSEWAKLNRLCYRPYWRDGDASDQSSSLSLPLPANFLKLPSDIACWVYMKSGFFVPWGYFSLLLIRLVLADSLPPPIVVALLFARLTEELAATVGDLFGGCDVDTTFGLISVLEDTWLAFLSSEGRIFFEAECWFVLIAVAAGSLLSSAGADDTELVVLFIWAARVVVSTFLMLASTAAALTYKQKFEFEIQSFDSVVQLIYLFYYQIGQAEPW